MPSVSNASTATPHPRRGRSLLAIAVCGLAPWSVLAMVDWAVTFRESAGMRGPILLTFLNELAWPALGIATAGSLVAALVSSGAAEGPWRRRIYDARNLLAAVVAGFAGYPLGLEILDHEPGAMAFAAGLFGLAALAFPIVGRMSGHLQAWPRVAAGGFLAAAAGAGAANAWLFVGLYEVLHAYLTLISVVCLWLACYCLWIAAGRQRWMRPVRWGVVAACAAFAAGPVGSLLGAEAGTRATAVMSTQTVFVRSVLPATRYDADGDRFAGVRWGGNDCDDETVGTNPRAREIPGDGIDNNCHMGDASAEAIAAYRAERLAGLRASMLSGPAAAVRDALLARVRRPNVVLLTVDAMRADSVSVLGYKRNTTPHIAEFAATATNFTRAYSPSGLTGQTFHALFTGVNGARVEWIKRGRRYYPLEDFRPTLAQALALDGYHTAAFTVEPFMERKDNLTRGFEALRTFKYKAYGGIEGAVAQYLAKRAKLPDKPFFLWVHYPYPHNPYVWREPYAAQLGRGVTKGNPRHRYETNLAYADAAVGRALDGLRKHGLWDNSIVIVSSDHGEEFRDHGGEFHGLTLYEELLHVPLAVRVPGAPAQKITAAVSLIDLMPTVLDLLGLPLPSLLDGRSLATTLLGGEDTPAPWMLHEIYYRGTSMQAVRMGNLKLIRNLMYDFEEFYDLAADPKERRNLVYLEPERAEPLRKVLLEYNELMAVDGRFDEAEIAGMFPRGQKVIAAVREKIATWRVR